MIKRTQWGKRRRWLIILVIILLLLASGSFMVRVQTNSRHRHQAPQSSTSTPQEADTTRPTITLNQPPDGQEVSGVITIKIEATDNVSVQKVEYLIDGVFAGVTYAQPFSFALDTTVFANGTHTILAKAYDGAGNVSSTKSITIVIKNTSPNVSGVRNETTNRSSVGASKPSAGKPTGTPYNSQGGSSPATTDSAPSVPTNVQISANDSYTTSVSWDASTDDSGGISYLVYRDDLQIATTTGVSYQDQTVVPGNTYAYNIVAKDTSNNQSATSLAPTITLAPTTNWLAVESPSPSSFDNAPGAIELGVKFRPLVDGKITGVRFYKAASSTGTHIGNLWASTGGAPLASATFTDETASGWQEVSFATPVDATAGTTYVASYFAPNGGYGYTSAYFASAGLTSQYLTAMASGVDGNNGVFRSGSSGFPTNSFDNTNYWVDVTFAPNKDAGGPSPKLADTSKVFPGYPGSNNTGVTVGKRLPKRDRKITIYNNNSLLENTEVNADINIQANNVTIRNVRVASPVSLIWGITQVTGKSGLTVEDAEIHGDGVHQLQYGIQDNGSNLTARRLNIHTMTQAVQSNMNVVLEDSFVHDQIYFAGDHSGGYLSTGGNNIAITHNTLLNPLNQTTTVGLFCDFGPVTNVTITNNLLSGGGYSAYAPSCAGSGGIKFINNKFARLMWPNGGFFGPVTLYNPAQPGNEWTNNTWYEDGTPVLP